MDKRNLVEDLQKAFNADDRTRNTEDTHDVEYKENTNTLFIRKQAADRILSSLNGETDPEANKMSEEEIFQRLHEDRKK